MFRTDCYTLERLFVLSSAKTRPYPVEQKRNVALRYFPSAQIPVRARQMYKSHLLISVLATKQTYGLFPPKINGASFPVWET